MISLINNKRPFKFTVTIISLIAGLLIFEGLFSGFLNNYKFGLKRVAYAQDQQKTNSAGISTDENDLNIYFFYSLTCPHCSKEKEYLDKIEQKFENLNIYKIEISTNRDNALLLMAVGQKLGTETSAVPFLLIGNTPIVGFLNEDTTGILIEDTIKSAFENKPEDIILKILNEAQNPRDQDANPAGPQNPISTLDGETQNSPGIDNPDITDEYKEPPPKEKYDYKNLIIDIPLIGKINTKDFSLPALTVVIAFLDGFNPCAMWVLLFLISMLLGIKNRKRMWLLGTTFIAASGFVYFLFLSAWLNFFLFIGYSTFVRYIIGFAGMAIGVYYLRDYYLNRNGGCQVTGNEKRQKIFHWIREIVIKNSIFLSLLGIILLAFAVNIVELLCSAGLPAVYTKILTMSSMSRLQYYLYLFLYIIIFMIDDLIIFIIAMVTLKTVGIESKYGKYSHLLGGILMFAIGIIMTFKPELLIF